MTVKKFLLITLMLSITSACVKTLTLDEKLAGKTKEQREVILKEECLKEASWTKPGGRTGHNSPAHIKRMSEICRKISAESR